MASTSTTAAQPKKRKRGRGADPQQTRDELITAALDSLVEEGFRGTTARSISTRAGCNQAAIYYHFNGIEPLLVQALARSSEERLARYQSSIVDGETLPQLVDRLERLYVEDRDSGHLALLTELVGGITASPELREGIDAATKPWLDFVEERITVAAATVPFGAMLPARELADLVFSLVIGVELRNRIDDNLDRSERLFTMARLAAGLVPKSEPARSKKSGKK